MRYHVIVIGAGASGLYCACRLLSKSRISLALIDSNSTAGKKLLLTGSGRCNLTNADIDTRYYMTDSPSALKRILEYHTNKDVIDFFRNELGVLVSEKSGLYYPSTYRADTVVNAMNNYLKDRGADFIMNTSVVSVESDNEGYVINNKYQARTVVIATGGASYPQTGSIGSIFRLTGNLVAPDEISPLFPALVPLKTLEKDIAAISGARAYCDITLYDNRKLDNALTVSSGEILFTQYGVSGICVLDISGYAVKAMAEGKRPVISVNFTKKSYNDTLCDIKYNIDKFPQRSAVCALNGLMRDDLLNIILDRSDIDKHKDVSALSEADIRKIAENMTAFKLTICGSLPFENAQITTGGLRLDSVNEYMEIKNSHGAFVCGETLDCNGICGGYNLQFCWSSAAVAAEGVLKCLN